MTDVYDLATEAEEKDRARALAIALRVAEARLRGINLSGLQLHDQDELRQGLRRLG